MGPIKKLKEAWGVFFLLVAAGNLVNGIWMLASPTSWYTHLPAAVPDFGPLNEHFVRDLGCMFCTWGALALWAALSPVRRKPALIILALWYVLHAWVHVLDTAQGRVGREHWVIDVPLTYLPAVLLCLMAFFFRPGRGRHES